MPDELSKVSSVFLAAARVPRAELYGALGDDQLPKYLEEDARLPFLGFVGPKYAVGGVILLAINPGGGGETYQARTAQDAQLLPLIEQFLNSSPTNVSQRFKAMSTDYANQIHTWNLRRILFPVIDACGKELDEIAYLNCFPYRTAGDKRPRSHALDSSWRQVVEPILGALRPSVAIALGKKAGLAAEKNFRGPATLFVVPRTIGDSRISEEAQVVLQAIREHSI